MVTNDWCITNYRNHGYHNDPKFLDRQVETTVQTETTSRLLIEQEQSDLSIHCLLFHSHHLLYMYHIMVEPLGL